MQAISVLSKASKEMVVTEPFPHIVIENALDDELYQQLEEQFPSRSFFEPNEMQLRNNKYIEMGVSSLESPEVTPLWKEFLRYHMSADYFADVLWVFGDAIRDYHPVIEERLGKPLAELSVGHRLDEYRVPAMKRPYDVMLDCQVQLDYSFTARPFRGPHVDSNAEIYAGLLYLRDSADESTGGGFAMWKANDVSKTYPTPRTIDTSYAGRGLDPADVELLSETPYKANTLAMFVNGWRSIHCARTRSPSVFPRRAVNIIGEICRFPEPGLFRTINSRAPQQPERQAGVGRRLVKKILGR